MFVVVLEALIRFAACMACVGVAICLGMGFVQATWYAGSSGEFLDWLLAAGVLAGTTAFFGGACLALKPYLCCRRRGP